MVIALSAALAAASVTHLAACGLGKSRLRYFTKLLLMPLVAALYCALVDRPAPAVLAAMFCGWVGDFFMIYKHKDAFLAAGMAAFGVGHILYVAHIGVIAAAAEPRLFTALAATLVPGAGWLLAGGCLFLCSDGILSFETFRDGDSNAADVAVMLTYIAAQTLLAIGFSMG